MTLEALSLQSDTAEDSQIVLQFLVTFREPQSYHLHAKK